VATKKVEELAEQDQRIDSGFVDVLQRLTFGEVGC
jgi:hypothetical protein